MTAIGRPAPPARPPHVRAVRWARERLFDGPGNSALTIVTLALLAWLVISVGVFALGAAEWEVVRANRQILFIGRFPRDEAMRIWPAVWGVLLLLGGSVGLWSPFGRREWITVGAVLVAVFVFLAHGDAAQMLVIGLAAGLAGYVAGGRARRTPAATRRAQVIVATGWALALPATAALLTLFDGVNTTLWGGVLLNVMLASVGIAGGFALGVPLALGRASDLPVIRYAATAYIELVRAAPLIAWLFLARFVLPDFLPPIDPIANLDIVARAMLVLAGFTAAYVAEIVRGGLQSLPRGQIEAANAVGLSTFQTTWLIVLPQALRAVIPALVGQFISLWKDTTLVFVLSLTELLGAARATLAQPAFIGRQAEVLLFAAVIFWTFAFTMSRYSQRIERALGVGSR